MMFVIATDEPKWSPHSTKISIARVATNMGEQSTLKLLTGSSAESTAAGTYTLALCRACAVTLSCLCVYGSLYGRCLCEVQL